MDFSLILFIILVATGSISLVHRLAVGPWQTSVPPTGAMGRGIRVVVEYSRSFFPVILIVFVLRSFIVEPFRIPSESMVPSLLVGDFILVNKFSYGIRLPVLDSKLIPVGAPSRGDVMVFRFPRDPSQHYIKRVIGLPGDKIRYQDKKLQINGRAVSRVLVVEQRGRSKNRTTLTSEYVESLGDSAHRIHIDEKVSSRDGEFTVPAGSYFVMGDNRDRSNDSRGTVGFVPESHIVGPAFLIWFSWNASDLGVRWSRIGDLIR